MGLNDALNQYEKVYKDFQKLVEGFVTSVTDLSWPKMEMMMNASK
jgi:hypothetical protein